MMHFTAGRVLELLAAAETVAFIHEEAFETVEATLTGALRLDELRPVDAWLEEGCHLAERWEDARQKLESRGPADARAWDELLLIVDALLTWKGQEP